LRAAATALATLCIALGAAVPSACAAAPLPPDLLTLEQQMAQLQIHSERFSFQVEIATELTGNNGLLSPGASSPSGGPPVPFALVFSGAGEASDSPAQVLVNASLFGLISTQTRVLGDTVYRYQPNAARIDNGRPWVRSPRRPGGETQGLDPSGVLESDLGGTQGTFSKLIETFNGAQGIVESGPATVDNLRVTEFDATLDPTTFLAKLKPQAKEPQHPLKSLFELGEGEGGKAHASPPGPPPAFKLELFIAPNGLPVRARFTFTAEGASLGIRLDTEAINVPVTVTPPPASETIDAAQLKRIERRRAERERREALRGCRHLHRKVAALCRRQARLRNPNRGSGSGGSLLLF